MRRSRSLASGAGSQIMLTTLGSGDPLPGLFLAFLFSGLFTPTHHSQLTGVRNSEGGRPYSWPNPADRKLLYSGNTSRFEPDFISVSKLSHWFSQSGAIDRSPYRCGHHISGFVRDVFAKQQVRAR